MKIPACIPALLRAGISVDDARILRNAAMALHRWFERECGDGTGAIERDDATGKPVWRSSYTGRAFYIPDRETGARKRIAAIMVRYPELRAYVQGDPRGAALWILRPQDSPVGEENGNYSCGLPVYK